jgi:hypothetical protein
VRFKARIIPLLSTGLTRNQVLVGGILCSSQGYYPMKLNA